MQGYRLAAQALGNGIDWRAVENAARRYGLRPDEDAGAPAPTPPAPHASSFEQTDHGATLTRTIPVQPRTLEELIDACQIDEARWRVAKWRANAWGDGMWQVRADLVPLLPHAVSAVDLAATYTDALRKAKAPRLPARKATRATGNTMAVLGLFDVHLAKLGWSREVGESYDLAIAVERWKRAGEDLLECVARDRPQKIVLPFGNDFFHVDGGTLPTTTAGTPQDTDTRYLKMVEAGIECVLWLIAQAAQLAPVEVLTVPGNHGRQTEQLVGVTLKYACAHDARVTVNAEPTTRKYVSWGKVLLGLTHGDEEKHAELPLIMAREVPQLWSSAEHHEWLLGHLHKKMMDEFKGVLVETLPSLAGADSWHSRKGYIGSAPRAVALVYDREHGRRAMYTHRAAA